MHKIRQAVNLSSPDGAKLVDLTESTLSAFSVLQPWCTAPLENSNSSTTLLFIVTLIKQYLSAIEDSIVASENGFIIAEDAINLANRIPERSKTGESFLGMVEMASRARQNTVEVVDGFRGLRRTIEGLIRDERDEQKLSGTVGDLPSGKADSHHLEASIPDTLEKLSNSVSEYIKWWNFMQMSEEAQRARTEQLVYSYNSLRERSVINKWIELRKEYLGYQEKISLLQITRLEEEKKQEEARRREEIKRQVGADR